MIEEICKADGRRWVKEGGELCFHCGHRPNRYQRKMCASKSLFLLWLFSKGGDWRWVHVNADAVHDAPKTLRSREYPRSAWWGLAHKKEKEPGENYSGLWMMTDLGVEYVHGRVAVPEYMFEEAGIVKYRSTERVLIGKAMGEKFDYPEILGKAKRRRVCPVMIKR